VNPEEELVKVYEFLGVSCSPEILKGALENNSFKSLSGGRKNGEEDTQSFYRKGISGDWKSHFSPKLCEQFITSTNGLMKELGYTK